MPGTSKKSLCQTDEDERLQTAYFLNPRPSLGKGSVVREKTKKSQEKEKENEKHVGLNDNTHNNNIILAHVAFRLLYYTKKKIDIRNLL